MAFETMTPAGRRDGIWTDSAVKRGPGLAVLLGVTALHSALIVALAVFDESRKPLPPAQEFGIPVIFAPVAPAPTASASHMLAASTLHVPAYQLPAPLADAPRLAMPPSGPAHQAPTPRHVAPVRVAAIPAPSSATDVPAPAARPAAPPPDDARAMAAWEGRIRQAVQDAAIYPMSARWLHRDGRTQLRFEYDRGTIEAASVVQTSHVGALDDAALIALSHAVLPPPPAELGSQKRTMMVWVAFTLVSDD